MPALWTYCSFFLFLAVRPVTSSNIPSSVIDLNDRFMEVKDDGFWFVKVTFLIGSCVFSYKTIYLNFSYMHHGVPTVNDWPRFGNTLVMPLQIK